LATEPQREQTPEVGLTGPWQSLQLVAPSAGGGLAPAFIIGIGTALTRCRQINFG
jgi:hypothetical protein